MLINKCVDKKNWIANVCLTIQMPRHGLRGREADCQERLLPQEVLLLHQVQTSARRNKLHQRAGQ
jgi:hypothetical protein